MAATLETGGSNRVIRVSTVNQVQDSSEMYSCDHWSHQKIVSR